ncbi:MAG TPA: PilT/PilU family type 4a pilus ATPase [Candidatus Paceibacterota bacterium]|nr:PilT/PilU family type 4a pilus ATPase [Verrucomicrobiota bacterium]HRY50231.1 PilT/PilU family type 4a pilus ATPase [Candidatus Paceibacterota bacterium]
MRRIELDHVLNTMLSFREDVSDINFTVDKSPQVESVGSLMPVPFQPAIEKLTPYQTETIALNLIGGRQRLTEDLLRTGSCDLSYAVGHKARFRVNVFSQRGNYSVVLRKLNTTIPTIESMGLPNVFYDIAKERTGLVLFTGATGTGKTTSLAALLNVINQNKPVHVITLEDPVEFVHPQQVATFNQRELGTDFDSFANGLRAALRQAPKVILVGEMRDRETVEIGLNAAETGHLVFSTLHTIDSGQTINRILGMFDQEEQKQIRQRLADTIRWVVSQRLAPKTAGGRHALFEIMGSNLRTQETIVLGESEGKTFYEIIEASYPFGWRTFDRACLDAYQEGEISEETAISYCSKRGIVVREIDKIKKQRGEVTSNLSRLQMKAAPGTKEAAANVPPVLKLKT